MTDFPPHELRTARLLLRPWREADAEMLQPILETNVQRLEQWIPPHVARPAPLPELRARLAGFAADFDAERACRFAILSSDEAQLYGEIALFFRSSDGRVQRTLADRGEIGYWLRGDVTGRGYATEAARAMMRLAVQAGLREIEIRCDGRNEASMGVARRLDFVIAVPADPANGSFDVVWNRALRHDDDAASDQQPVPRSHPSR